MNYYNNIVFVTKYIKLVLCSKNMGFKKGINKCVECEKKMSEDPNEAGMCSKCGSGARIDSEIQKELTDLGIL
jgi:hypothetical protein